MIDILGSVGSLFGGGATTKRKKKSVNKNKPLPKTMLNKLKGSKFALVSKSTLSRLKSRVSRKRAW